MSGHQLPRPLEVPRGLVELALLQVHHAEVVVGGAEEEVGGESLALGLGHVGRDQVAACVESSWARTESRRDSLSGE